MRLLKIIAFVAITSSWALADVATDITTIQSVGTEAAGHVAAVEAAARLATADADSIIPLLNGMQTKNPLGNNWLRGTIAAVVDRALADGKAIPKDDLVAYIKQTDNSPVARYVAFQTLKSLDEETSTNLVPTMTNDPCLDLRRLAVEFLIKKAPAADNEIAAWRTALQSARDVDQIETIAEKLQSLEAPPNLIEHFGFLTKWQLVGPFDNVGSKSFDVAYPPEKNVDLSATYDGQADKIKWIEHSTDDKFGTVDLNTALDKHKGAIAYAFTRFESSADEPVPAELRVGCINANKVWLNGELLFANEVYHSGTVIDQYVGKGTLKPGENSILVKIAQNEQSESWAQRWQFQLRVCDTLGTAIQQDSEATK